MNTSFEQSKESTRQNSPTGGLLPARDRVLEVACEMFAETGFHGTHLREICRRAGTNVAGVCYHFDSKEGLYEAVILEAGRRLSEHDGSLLIPPQLPPEQKLLKLVESLIQKLSAGGAWIARLLGRELVDATGRAHNYAGFGLERDFVLLQALMRELCGSKANSEAIRLHALSLMSECVAYCLAGENPRHPFAQLAVKLPGQARMAQLLAKRLLGALNQEKTEPEVSNP